MQGTDLSAPASPGPAPALDPWPSAQRIEAYAGEVRFNLIRLAAIVFFYGRHILDVYLWKGTPIAPSYQLHVTLLILAWTAAVLVLHACLSRRYYPPALKYIAVIWDAAMVTALGFLGGPKTPLLLLFFPVIASAGLRLSLRLVNVATAAAVLGYILVVMRYAWVEVGFDRYYATPELRIPRSHQAIFVLSLLVTGVLAGQWVRQARRLVAGHPNLISSVAEPNGGNHG